MSRKQGCGPVFLGILFVLVAVAILAAFVGAMILSGEIPIYAPRLTGFQPDPNYAFQPTTPLTFTFDQPMDTTSVEAYLVIGPPVEGTFHWKRDRTQVTFVPQGEGFEPGVSYTVRLLEGARAGTIPRTMASPFTYVWSFSLPPLLDSASPAPGEKDVGARTLLQATFNYALDCKASRAAFFINPAAPGDVDCDGYSLTFSPTAPLAPGTAYSAGLAHVFLLDDGWPRPGVQWQFETAAPLTVVKALPGEGAALSDLWTPVRITFNRPVRADTALERFSLNLEDGPPLSGEVTWQEGGTVFLFQPDEPLRPEARYRYTLEPGVRDELGFQVGASLARSFSTEPMLSRYAPADGARNVKLDGAVRLAFTRPMDLDSVEAGLSFSPPLAGEFTWEGNRVEFAPDGGLAAETEYRATLSAGVRDASGAPLSESTTWSFSTQPFLLSSRPEEGAKLTSLLTPLRFTFALPMDRDSVQAALSLSPETEGRFEWTDGDRQAAFYPEPSWLAGTEYKVRLSGSARTAAGLQTLGQDQALSFLTAAAEVEFGEGPNAQVMDAEGGRAFQFVTRGADVLDFRLYAITLTQFLDLYSSGFRGIGPQEARIVDTGSLTPTVAWREALVPIDSGYRRGDWQPAEAHIPADVPPGLYILASTPPVADGESLGSDTLLIALTRHALVLKRALSGSGSRTQAELVAWDTELSGGAPVISATVHLYDRDGSFLAEGLTDAQGLLALDVPGDPGPLLALSEKDGDVTLCGLSNEWSESGWWWWWTQPPSRPRYTLYSYTDRPIYRPAQTVYFKDWARADDDVSYTLTGPDLPVTVRLRDARNNLVASQVLTPTSFGSVYGQFQLSDEPMLGTWHLESEIDGAIARQPLKVEEYRKPEYEVTVSTPQEIYVHGEAISVTVDAAYYFGQPVASADVELLVYPTYSDYYSAGEEPEFGYPLLSEGGRTDDEGRWTVLLDSASVFSEGDRSRRATLALEATVSDKSGQSVSSYESVVVLRTSEDITLVLERHGFQPDEEIGFSAYVHDRDGRPAPGVELTARALGWDEQEAASSVATTDERGQARFSLRLKEQGWYDLLVQGSDDGGREMSARDGIWIYDPTGQAPWYGGQWGGEPLLTVSADGSTYQVGDEAQLLVHAPTAGPALLTLERGATRLAEPIDLVSGTNLITLPIRADYAPNIQVTVNQFGPPVASEWGGPQSRPEATLCQASTEILVPMSNRKLTVTLTSAQETYGPGDEAQFEVQVSDRDGRPVVAEVSLAVVDEALYALAEDMSRDPFAVFYAPRLNVVRTFDSLHPRRWLFPERPGMGGGDGGEGGAPRRDFLDTAYWAPTIVTDQEGRATITFELPDNLTEWRALARAVTTDTLLGQTTTQITVRKDLVVRPVLPRFLIQGDTITLTAVVHNYSGRAVSATVELELDGLVPLPEGAKDRTEERVVSLPAGGSATVGWLVQAGEPGEAQVRVQATAAFGARIVGRDAVELPLPIRPLVIPEIATQAGTLTPDQPTETITISLPSDAIEGLSRLEINLAPSVAPGLLDGLEYLIDYPFGCVEQTMSRVLPNAMVARTFRKLGIRNEFLEADLPPMIDLGLQKLYGYQHNDGGWGWWYDDSTDLNQTAYVLFGLAMTEQAGFEVDEGVLERGAEALRQMLPGADPRAQAYGAYVLSMAGQPLTVTLTLSDALELDMFSRAALAIALKASGDRESAAALLDSLRESAIQDATTVYWSDEGDQAVYSRKVMGSTVRTTAMAVDALAKLDPASPLLAKAVRWLMEQRQGQGWGDTQKTSFAILALSDYLLASREQASATSYQVYVNDRLWQAGPLAQISSSETQVLTYSHTLSPTLLLPGKSQVQIVLGAEGEKPAGRLYYTLRSEVQRAPAGAEIPGLQTHERSITVQREYRLRGSQGPMTEFQAGDLVEVVLTLDVPEETWYVVVDDPLPAGFEALNERLGTTSHLSTLYEEPVYFWEQYGYNRKDVRDEQVSFFITYLPPGEKTLTYLLRAIHAGSFTALPAQVYPMYEPEVWSRSQSSRCQIKEP